MASKKVTKKAPKKPAKSSKNLDALRRWIHCRKVVHNEAVRTRALVSPTSEIALDCAQSLSEAREHYNDSELAAAWREATTRSVDNGDG